MSDVAIVVPVRNTPKGALSECVNSMLTQSYRKIHIILVDDASDNEETINALEEFKELDDRVEIVHNNTPLGSGESRNVGFRCVNEEYAIFFDSDDIMFEDCILRLISKIKEFDSDVCVNGYEMFCDYENGERRVINRVDRRKEYNGKDWSFLLEDGLPPWNKLCRVDYLKKENISFQSLSSDNDLYFAAMTLLCTDQISYTGYIGSQYRCDTEYQISSKRNPFNTYEAIIKVRDEIKRKKIYRKEHDEMIKSFFWVTSCNNIIEGKNEVLKKEYYGFCQELIRKGDLSCNNYKGREIIDKWRANSYESRWYKIKGDYEKQLEERSGEIAGIFANKSDIYVWGRGQRAKAFELFAATNNIIIKGICDRKNSSTCQKDDFGIEIVKTDTVLSEGECIVASNHGIFLELQEIIDVNKLIDLELLCPL